MASRSPDKPALVASYRKLTGDTRARVLRHAQQQWAGVDSWSDSAADRLVAQLLPVVLGGQRVVASATAAFLRTWLDVPGSRTSTLLDLDQVTGTALRGVDPAVVYRRPVIESRATFAKLRKAGALDRRQVIDAAIDTGLRRLLGTASTDLQLTATLTSRQVLKAEKVKVYRRVARPGACPLCLAASDRVYHVADLLPIHNSCHCIVVPGGVLPEALQRAGNDQDPTGGRGLQIGQNGEIGPVLEWGDQTKGAGRRRRRTPAVSGSGTGGTPPAKPPTSGGPADEPLEGRRAEAHLDQTLGEYMANLPEAAKEAAQQWHGPGYRDIQAAQLGQRLKRPTMKWTRAEWLGTQLLGAIRKAEPVGRYVTLYRRAGRVDEGTLVTFMSTSTRRVIAQRVGRGESLFEVLVSPDVRGLWIKSAEQFEFLIGPGSILKIVRDSKGEILRVTVQNGGD